MTNFITMVNRVTTELRRSNLTADAKAAINDAIAEAATDRFYFNEMKSVTFPTVIGQEYYDDQGLIEIDAAYYSIGGVRYNLAIVSNTRVDARASGNTVSGRPDEVARYGGQLRFDPIPNLVTTITLSGFGKLSPYPLVGDTDTNAWMTTGERYIRALAKRNLLRDVIRDYGEARVLDAIASDYRTNLFEETALKTSTGALTPTKF